MKQEIEKTAEAQVPMVASQGTEEILNSDVILPRVMLMQGASEAVAQRTAQLGDIIRSTTAEKLGDPDAPFLFIPLTFKNKWLIQEIQEGKSKHLFRGFEARNAANEHLPWDYELDGKQMKRVKMLDVYALLPGDVDAEEKAVADLAESGELPDLNDTLLPVVISFKATSYKAGQAVVTHFTKAKGMAEKTGNPAIKPHAYTMSLGCAMDSNDSGDFYIYKCTTAGRLSKSQAMAADLWHKILQDRPDIRVDEAEEATPESAAPSTGEAHF